MSLFAFLFSAGAWAQTQNGRIEGVVLDAATHRPVSKAVVTAAIMTSVTGAGDQGSQIISTDLNGAFAFNNLSAGPYQLTIQHQNYPQGRSGMARKIVQVSASDSTARVTVELIPGAAISGRVVDEDGDPLAGCSVQPHPAKNFKQGVAFRQSAIREDGSYRLSGIPAGKYFITARCAAAVFQPRPLSAGPDPPATAAYPIQFYPSASDLQSAQAMELTPGTEKPGIDFQMRPASVTYLQGRLVAGSATWQGRNDIQVRLVPIDGEIAFLNGLGAAGRVNPADGSFEISRVFPGSYYLAASSQFTGPAQRDNNGIAGAMVRVDVGTGPQEVAVQLQRGVDLSGRVDIDSNPGSVNQIAPNRFGIQLTSDYPIAGPPPSATVSEDGSFTIKGVPPGFWKILLPGPGFLKSAWMGSDEITHMPLDLTSGTAAPLRIVASTNMGAIRGTAPPGQMVFTERIDDARTQEEHVAQADVTGQFAIQNVPPGTYRVAAAEFGSPMPEEGGQEVTVNEGDTVTIEVKGASQ